jgi:hypothetical protein
MLTIIRERCRAPSMRSATALSLLAMILGGSGCTLTSESAFLHDVQTLDASAADGAHQDAADHPRVDVTDTIEVDALDVVVEDGPRADVVDAQDVPRFDALDIVVHDVPLDLPTMDVLDTPHVDAFDAPDITNVDVPFFDVILRDVTNVDVMFYDVPPSDVHPDAGRVPLNHRPDDTACSAPAPPGDCTFAFGSCATDATCTAGTNGRCIMTTGGAVTCRCTYDTCTHDTDCPTGQTCACHGTAYTNGDGNTCTMGNCRVDSDCGVGGYCSPSHAQLGCGGIAGYYCHTAGDTCIDDSDCLSGTGIQVCAYSTTLLHWACTVELLCP